MGVFRVNKPVIGRGKSLAAKKH